MTQNDALNILKTGVNVFLTGEPGSGKTHTLRSYIEYLKEHDIAHAITASTGIAATHIGGVTIHSWTGIGARNDISAYEIDRIATTEHIVKRINKAKVLIIDEVSMLSGSLLNSIDLLLKNIKGNEEAFGGLQVVFVGDFFQLPPIKRNFEEDDFAFMSKAWNNSGVVVCYLEEQHRQSDGVLVSILSAIRNDNLTQDHFDVLKSKIIKIENIKNETKLFTHNKDVDSFNLEKLNSIKGKKYIFETKTKGSPKLVEALLRGCLSPEILELKVGAVVMCTKNNTARAFVNGTIGTVIGFGSNGGYPIIKTDKGNEILVEPMTWQIEEDGKVKAEITQVPLRHAWAITVHKSQGMTLTSATIDLSKTFEHGQGYVALSRLSSIDNLELLGINNRALSVHDTVKEMDGFFRNESSKSENFLYTESGDSLEKIQEKFIDFCGGTKNKIDKSKNKKLSTHDETLELVRSGKNINQIAKIRDLKINTIIDHVYVLHERGELSSQDIALLPEAGLAKNLSKIYRIFNEIGAEKLTPVYEHFAGGYSYDDLRLARLIYGVINK